MLHDMPIRSMVMDSIANDYEDFRMISREVMKWASERALYVETGEVADALMDLVECGFAKAYRLSANSPFETVERPEAREISEYYFLLTDEGRASLEHSDAESG